MEFTLHRAKKIDPDLYACIISGDGLRTPLAIALANSFAKQGVPAARVKAIKYFWTKRAPKIMSADLRRYMTRRLKRNPRARFIFVGYSFGAGTLPFALNRLPFNLKKQVAHAILIAPMEKVDFEFFFRSWFYKSTSAAQYSAPEIQSLSLHVPVLYIYGEEDYAGPREDLSPCKDLQIICLSGGHDLNKDYNTLFATIVASVPVLQNAVVL